MVTEICLFSAEKSTKYNYRRVREIQKQVLLNLWKSAIEREYLNSSSLRKICLLINLPYLLFGNGCVFLWPAETQNLKVLSTKKLVVEWASEPCFHPHIHPFFCGTHSSSPALLRPLCCAAYMHLLASRLADHTSILNWEDDSRGITTFIFGCKFAHASC
jgi:hypothetical protein